MSLAQQAAASETRHAAADLCARISGDLGALRVLLDDTGLDGASEILGEIVEEFDRLAEHVARPQMEMK